MSFCQAVFRQLLRVLLVFGVVCVLAACGSSPTKQRRPAAYSTTQAPPISQEQAGDVTIYALGLVGTPYRYGGNTPDSGFDCSGLISHVYKSRASRALPRSVAGLQYWGQQIETDELRSGDLVVFGRTDSATHAGIYVGEGRFVHAPSSGGEVRLDRLNSKYWAAQRVAFRRP